ncbi:hypothetical protein NHU87_10115 [Pseudomonas mandelii]|nr:hypothetical protein [Pseudomonas mandelii]MCO8310995.1 hypothetical protein [Pseudomonas mandelii]
MTEDTFTHCFAAPRADAKNNYNDYRRVLIDSANSLAPSHQRITMAACGRECEEFDHVFCQKYCHRGKGFCPHWRQSGA